MAKCNSCGAEISFFTSMHGMCKECYFSSLRKKNPEQYAEDERQKAAIEGVMLTTEACPAGLKIVERIEVVTAECAFGMNIFKDLFAGMRDIVGGRSEAVQKTLRDSRRVALHELKREAHEVGANAVIGVDLDYVELSGAGNMILLVASGTAVRLEDT